MTLPSSDYLLITPTPLETPELSAPARCLIPLVLSSASALTPCAASTASSTRKSFKHVFLKPISNSFSAFLSESLPKNSSSEFSSKP
ncbi:hypothetical protein ACSBR2_001577 [Camellia fascicularis]